MLPLVNPNPLSPYLESRHDCCLAGRLALQCMAACEALKQLRVELLGLL